VVKNDRIISSDKRILGADDRVGVTVLMEILNLIANKKINYPNLEIIFLVSEEIGLLGSKNLDYSKISSKVGFNFDCSAPVGNVVVKAPTTVDFDIHFIGKEAHSAVAPEKGINAIQMASEAIGLFNLPQKTDNTIFNIGKIKGGKAPNIIPGEVIITGELRSFNQEQIDKYWHKVNECAQLVVKKLGGSYKINWPVRYKSFKLDETSAALQIAKSAIKKANVKFMPITYLGGSDANIFNQKNISTVNIGLGYTNNHSCDEYITLANLVKDVEIGTRIVQNAADFKRK
jgi:tripeptide aminopeptidase